MVNLHNAPLGKVSNYPSQYDPSLLFPISRVEGRERSNISSPLPFTGYDRWTAYEISWLDLDGKPRVVIGHFSFSHNSPNIIESKSFKLYLNSFNMSTFASQATVAAMMEKDLSAACGAAVIVELTPLSDRQNLVTQWSTPSLDSYPLLPKDAREQPLQALDTQTRVKAKWQTHLFRSLCPVTAQPDWASVRIEYQGYELDPSALLTYLVAFRSHQGFHEQCVEQMFNEILHATEAQSLLIEARFMRRGGLDINPVRMKGMFEVSNHRLSRQ